MIWKLFLAFTLIPAMELYLLITIGSYVGALPTVMIIAVTGFAGAWLAKREGIAVLQQLADELARGVPPASRLAEGALVIAGGLLLITPGVLTDLTGFLLILPPSRRFVAPRLVAWLGKNFVFHASTGGVSGATGSGAPPHDRGDQQHLPFDHPIA